MSILTAAYEPNPGYLCEAYESLESQGVDWQWVIQVDGTPGDAERIPSEIASDERVSIAANCERLGAAATRNRGLLRCAHELVQNLDADDVFYPGAIRRLADAIEPGSVALAFGQSHRFHPDGTMEHWQPAPWPAGQVAAGTIGDTWLETGRHHVSLSAAMWKAVYVHACGGWGALHGMEDVHLLMGVSEDHPAAYVDEAVLRSRVHPKQSTNQLALTGDRELRHRALVASRLLASRALKNHDRPSSRTVRTPSGDEVPLPHHFQTR